MTKSPLFLRVVWLVLSVWLVGSAHAFDHFSPAWSTYVGGEFESDRVNAIAVGSDSSVYMGGICPSGVIQNNAGDSPSIGYDGFVAKTSSSGALLWARDFSDYVDYYDDILALALGPSHIFAAGYSRGSSVTTKTFAFIAAIDTSDGTVSWYDNSIGSLDYEATNRFSAVTVATDGSVYAVGHTSASNQLNTAPAYQIGNTTYGTNLIGGLDAFVVKYSPTGTRLWCRYLGGANDDSANAVAIGSDGHLYVAGQTRSPNWVSLSASGTANATNAAGFLVKLATNNGAHVWSSYLDGAKDDAVTAMRTASGAGGETILFLGGHTASSDFLGSATNPGAAYAGNTDGFITRITDTSTAFRVDWRRFEGGSANDRISALDMLTDGRLVAGGTSASGGWIADTGDNQTHHGMQDGFVALLNSTNGALSWATCIGGSDDDQLHAIAAHADTFLTAGHTFSADWPIGGGFWGEWNKDDLWGDLFSFGYTVKWQPGSALPPTITLDPIDRVVQEHNTVTFTVAASGTAPLFYRWFRDGVLLPGATLSNLTFTAAYADDGATYSCLVSNVAGTATSSGATLTVIPMGTLSVTLSPADAVTRGARWRLDDDPAWRSSGTTNLPTGTYAISFTNIPGWTEPALTNVQVTHAATTAITAVYIPILPEAARAITGTNVTLSVIAPAGLSSWTLTETLPIGVTPANIVSDGTSSSWNPTARTLSFTGPESVTKSLSYSVSSATSGVYTVIGTVTSVLANVAAPVTGDDRILNAKIIRTIDGTNVTITITVPPTAGYWMINETVPTGLMPFGMDGGMFIGNNGGLLTWLVSSAEVLSYSVTGDPDTYLLSGTGNPEPIFGDTLLTIPGEETDIPPPDILAFIPTPTNTYILVFTSAVDQAYIILTNSALDNPDGWAPCLPSVTGNAGTTPCEVPANGPRLFYRVRLDE